MRRGVYRSGRGEGTSNAIWVWEGKKCPHHSPRLARSRLQQHLHHHQVFIWRRRRLWRRRRIFLISPLYEFHFSGVVSPLLSFTHSHSRLNNSPSSSSHTLIFSKMSALTIWPPRRFCRLPGKEGRKGSVRLDKYFFKSHKKIGK